MCPVARNRSVQHTLVSFQVHVIPKRSTTTRKGLLLEGRCSWTNPTCWSFPFALLWRWFYFYFFNFNLLDIYRLIDSETRGHVNVSTCSPAVDDLLCISNGLMVWNLFCFNFCPWSNVLFETDRWCNRFWSAWSSSILNCHWEAECNYLDDVDGRGRRRRLWQENHASDSRGSTWHVPGRLLPCRQRVSRVPAGRVPAAGQQVGSNILYKTKARVLTWFSWFILVKLDDLVTTNINFSIIFGQTDWTKRVRYYSDVLDTE